MGECCEGFVLPDGGASNWLCVVLYCFALAVDVAVLFVLLYNLVLLRKGFRSWSGEVLAFHLYGAAALALRVLVIRGLVSDRRDPTQPRGDDTHQPLAFHVGSCAGTLQWGLLACAMTSYTTHWYQLLHILRFGPGAASIGVPCLVFVRRVLTVVFVGFFVLHASLPSHNRALLLFWRPFVSVYVFGVLVLLLTLSRVPKLVASRVNEKLSSPRYRGSSLARPCECMWLFGVMHSIGERIARLVDDGRRRQSDDSITEHSHYVSIVASNREQLDALADRLSQRVFFAAMVLVFNFCALLVVFVLWWNDMKGSECARQYMTTVTAVCTAVCVLFAGTSLLQTIAPHPGSAHHSMSPDH